MDIFNRKRVEELEAEVKRLRHIELERNNYREELRSTERELERVVNIKDTIPDGCTPGSYCRACEFVKPYYYSNYVFSAGHHTVVAGYICGKGELCKNFAQKEIEKND